MEPHHEEHSCCKSEGKAPKPWFLKPLFWLALVSAALIGLSYLIPAFLHFRHSFFEYIRMMAAPIFAGLILGGLIDYFIPKEYISKYLAQGTKRTVFYAAGLGFLMSACSHGIIALSMSLHKKGASGPAVVSFLLASPWANLPITFLLVGFFGAYGLIIIFAALLVSITTGLAFQILDKKGWIESNRHSVKVHSDFSIRKDIAKRAREYRFTAPGFLRDARGVTQSTVALGDMVLGWMLLGIILASLSSAFVPAGIFEKFFGPSILGLLMTLGAATVLEVCSEGTSPLAFEIYRQTGAFGNAFAFLMGGVVTDYTEIGLVWQNIGKKTAIWMLLITIPQVILLGWLLNSLF